MHINDVLARNGMACRCGKTHVCGLKKTFIGSGALQHLPEAIALLHGTKAFVFSDQTTYSAAGKAVCHLLAEHQIPYTDYSLPHDAPEPNEENVGSAVMHFDYSCDLIVSVGSGVVNDIGKILSMISGRPYVIVATAPSMDGYASNSSSMTRDGLKISLPSRCADVIIGDTDILANAPLRMLQSGLGDMLAKYVSICEWRIAHTILDEYYCDEIADLVRTSLHRCVDNAQGLLQRDPTAVEAVFEGLVLSGIAMTYADVSRPASGVEHYISHVWDMRGLEFGTNVSLHGIQCAIGTLITARLYEQLVQCSPNREKALQYVAHFDYTEWSRKLTDFLGRSAKSMIALEAKEHKYDAIAHGKRLDRIIAQWPAILQIIAEELPSAVKIEALLDSIGAPKRPSEIGIDETLLPMTLQATKDIRDKYVFSRLAWDLGILDELTL